jgi:DNA-binding XRE family transcriptional regulator
MSETPDDAVILSRAEYEALIERIEDAEDNAFLDTIEARERAIGKENARADYLPAEIVRRLIDGDHPVRVWRAHRGLTREALAAAAGVAPSYLSEIETRRKPGSFHALASLARALQISLDDLAAWLEPRQE